MNKIIGWIKLHWTEYICTKSTALALMLIYMEIFHSNTISEFWRMLLGNIGHNEVLNAICNIIIGILIRSKK